MLNVQTISVLCFQHTHCTKSRFKKPGCSKWYQFLYDKFRNSWIRRIHGSPKINICSNFRILFFGWCKSNAIDLFWSHFKKFFWDFEGQHFWQIYNWKRINYSGHFLGWSQCAANPAILIVQTFFGQLVKMTVYNFFHVNIVVIEFSHMAMQLCEHVILIPCYIFFP